jgi:hypothetical protein
MKWNDWETTWEGVCRRAKRRRIALRFGLDHMYREMINNLHPSLTECDRWRFEAEYCWIRSKRPYFNVWPAITPGLLSLNLDTPASLIRPDIQELSIRFPLNSTAISFQSQGKLHCVKSVFAAIRRNRLRLLVDYGWRDRGDIAFGVCEIELLSDRPLGEIIDELWSRQPAGDIGDPEMSIESVRSCFQLVCCLFLIDRDDESLVTPDVLEDDRGKWEQTRDVSLVERARKKGVVGWDIGKEMHERAEIDPHYRRPHPALRHTGKGGLIPKIVLVKGTFVHRKKLTEVPTGYLDDEQPARCEPVT